MPFTHAVMRTKDSPLSLSLSLSGSPFEKKDAFCWWMYQGMWSEPNDYMGRQTYHTVIDSLVELLPASVSFHLGFLPQSCGVNFVSMKFMTA